ncbi:MAG: hypothetical protein B6D64_11950 [Bacteroidetes bacterium 4484_276]|nr:MAG: hypothetical protein B6D64_11950 [Bacteroidetes bacterium 4484_276]
MSTISFDTLAYAKKLMAAGVPAKQAEVQAETFAEIIDERIATKRDFKEMETLLSMDIKELESRITANIIKWVAGMLVAQAAIVATSVNLL